jgi:hypothetical protein
MGHELRVRNTAYVQTVIDGILEGNGLIKRYGHRWEVHKYCSALCHVLDCAYRRCICTALHCVMYWTVLIGGAYVLQCNVSCTGLCR